MLPVDLAIIGESRTSASDSQSVVGEYMDSRDVGTRNERTIPTVQSGGPEGVRLSLAKTTARLTSIEKNIARANNISIM